MWCSAVVLVVLSSLRLASGTTLVGAHYSGGVIIGSDGRTSRGSYATTMSAKKIGEILDCDEATIYIARCGSAATSQRCLEDLRLEFLRFEHGRSTRTVLAAARLAQRKLSSSQSTSLLCAGFDESRGLQLFQILSGGGLVQSSEFCVLGSGSAYIYGWCDDKWTPNMSKEECIAFVQKAVELAGDRDGSSGGDTEIVSIEPGQRAQRIRLARGRL